jgi:hypothetical protein
VVDYVSNLIRNQEKNPPAQTLTLKLYIPGIALTVHILRKEEGWVQHEVRMREREIGR